MEKKAFKTTTANIKFTCELRDYLEEVAGSSFYDVGVKLHRRGGQAVRRGRSQTG